MHINISINVWALKLAQLKSIEQKINLNCNCKNLNSTIKLFIDNVLLIETY